MTLPTLDRFKTAEGKISLWVKIAGIAIGILIPLSGALVGYGTLKSDTSNNKIRVDKVEERVDDHEKRIRDSEIGRAHHEEIDLQVVEALKDVKQELKKQRR